MRDPFKHSDKEFVAGVNRVYIGELPPHLAHTGVPRDVARNGMFKLIGREGNMLHFKTGTRYSTSCSGKVLTSLQTGQELCFVEYEGARIRLEASLTTELSMVQVSFPASGYSLVSTVFPTGMW